MVTVELDKAVRAIPAYREEEQMEEIEPGKKSGRVKLAATSVHWK